MRPECGEHASSLAQKSRLKAPGRRDRFTVSGCGRSLTTRCPYSYGLYDCGRSRRRVRVDRDSTPYPVAQADVGRGAMARRGADGTPHLRVFFGPADLVAAASADLIRMRLTLHEHAPVDGDRCNAQLTIFAEEQPVTFEPTTVEGRSADYSVPLEHLVAVTEHPPIRLELCGVDLRFGMRELRALRHFVRLAQEPPTGG